MFSKNGIELQTLLSVVGRSYFPNLLARWTKMVATDANIDSFVQNSMAYIRKHNFDGIDIDWQFPGACESEDRCSPVTDAGRFRVLLEKFRNAIESENVPSEDKMIISSTAGPKKNQIYKANDDTSSTSALLQGTAAIISDVNATFSLTSNSTETVSVIANSTVSVVSKKTSDLKVEIWAPVLAFIFLAVIITLIVRCVKRATAKVTNHSVRSDRKARDSDVDTVYENYASSDNGNSIKHGESYYSQPYTAYDAGYAEYGDHYAEYKKPIKGFGQPFRAIF